MAVNYAYNDAESDPATKRCSGMFSTTSPEPTSTTLVEIPVNDPEYICKYYINGEWYEDAAGTIPWTSSLL